jgi:hypothetical protein
VGDGLAGRVHAEDAARLAGTGVLVQGPQYPRPGGGGGHPAVTLHGR